MGTLLLDIHQAEEILENLTHNSSARDKGKLRASGIYRRHGTQEQIETPLVRYSEQQSK